MNSIEGHDHSCCKGGLIGVDGDSWRSEFALGIDCAKEFSAGPEYDPNSQGNVLSCALAGRLTMPCVRTWLLRFELRRILLTRWFSLVRRLLGKASWLDRRKMVRGEFLE